MARRSIWELTPRQSIEAECVRRGRPRVVAGCLALLGGDHADTAFVRALAGPAADAHLDGTATGEHWFRVWGARGLLGDSWATRSTPSPRCATTPCRGSGWQPSGRWLSSRRPVPERVATPCRPWPGATG